MRMWNVNPKKMCSKHLRGEHVEMHMMVGWLNKNKSIKGFLDKKLIEVHNIQKRHDIIAIEMIRRKMKHMSPLKFKFNKKLGKVDIQANYKELSRRCKDCKKLQNGK